MRIGSLSLLFLLAACDRGEEPSTVEARGEPVVHEETPREPEPEPEPEPALAEPTPEALEAEAARLEQTVHEALLAAEEAETGSTACESAHDGIAALVARVAAQYPDETRPIPPRLAFIQICERLDPEVQRCLIPSHAMRNAAACERISEGIPPEELERLETVLHSD